MMGGQLLQGSQGIVDHDDIGVVQRPVFDGVLNDEITYAAFIQLVHEQVPIPARPAKGKEQRVIGEDQAAAVQQQVFNVIVAASLQEFTLQDPAYMND